MLLKRRFEFRTTVLSIGVVFILTFIALRSLLHPGLPPTHDGEYHVIRFYEFNKVLTEGVWYPRWAPDLNFGYGIPLFNYVYPLPNYVASVFHLFGVSFIDAFKLSMFFASFVGAIFMYAWARLFWGTWGGIVSSVFYTYSPYHFLDIYIRGSVGEVWVLGLFPLFLWAVTKVIRGKKLFFLPITSLSLSFVILSHNILSMLLFPFALSYIILLIFLRKEGKHLVFLSCFMVLLALGLSSIFWVPALFERPYVRGLYVFSFTHHFVELYQLIFPSWGSGFSADQTTQGLSPQIGLANLSALFTSVVLMIRGFKKDSNIRINVFVICWTFISILFMLSISLPVWNIVPFMSYAQFPWRFLSLTILLCSFLAGSVVYSLKWRILPVVFILLAFTLGVGYARPAFYHLRDDAYYVTRSNFIDGTNSPGEAFNTIWSNNITERKKERLEIIEGKGEVQTKNVKTHIQEFTVSTVGNARLLFNTMFFPGWTVFIDGRKTEIKIATNGAMMVEVGGGKHVVEAKLLDTQVRLFAGVIFLISFVVTFSLVFLPTSMRKYVVR